MKKGLIDWDLLNFEIDRKLWLEGCVSFWDWLLQTTNSTKLWKYVLKFWALIWKASTFFKHYQYKHHSKYKIKFIF